MYKTIDNEREHGVLLYFLWKVMLGYSTGRLDTGWAKPQRFLPSCPLIGPLAFAEVSLIECYGLVRALTPTTMSTNIMLNAIGLSNDFWWGKSDWEIIWIVQALTFAMVVAWKVGFMVTSWLWQWQPFYLSFWNDSYDTPVLRGSYDQPQTYRLAHSKCSASVHSLLTYLVPMPDTEETEVNETVSGLSELVNSFFETWISLCSPG